MYACTNYPSKAALKRDVAAGREVQIYSPGLGTPKSYGTEYLEGPHYPAPHTWYATVTMKAGLVVKVR